MAYFRRPVEQYEELLSDDPSDNPDDPVYKHAPLPKVPKRAKKTTTRTLKTLLQGRKQKYTKSSRHVYSMLKGNQIKQDVAQEWAAHLERKRERLDIEHKNKNVLPLTDTEFAAIMRPKRLHFFNKTLSEKYQNETPQIKAQVEEEKAKVARMTTDPAAAREK